MTFFSNQLRSVWLFALAIVAVACSDDDDNVNPRIPDSARDGYFIVNEGSFGGGNTSLSYYDRTNDTTLNEVFATANGRPLGDQTQSMTVIGERGFIVVQNSAKIEVINTDDFTSIATITDGIVSPRYLIGVDDTKAYVTDWGADGVTGTVKVIDLATYMVTDSVRVGAGPNGLLRHDGRVYVANRGGFGYDSTVMVLNPQTDTVVDTLVVGPNPEGLVVDANGALWVAGSGRSIFDPNDDSPNLPGFVARLAADTVALLMDLNEAGYNTLNLAIDNTGEQLYYGYNQGVYRLGITDTTLPSAPLITGNLYGLGVDPVTNEVLVGDNIFTSEGLYYRYTPTGELIESYTAGIAPNGFAF